MLWLLPKDLWKPQNSLSLFLHLSPLVSTNQNPTIMITRKSSWQEMAGIMESNYDKKSYREYPKILYWNHYNSTFTYAIFFSSWRAVILKTMQMTIPHIKQEKCWGSFERFRECVVKAVSMVYWNELKGNANKCQLLISSGENYQAIRNWYRL